MRQRTAAKTRRVNPREFQYTNFAPVFARLARLATLLLLVSSSCHSPDNFLAPTDNYHSSFEAALSSNLAREIFWSEPERPAIGQGRICRFRKVKKSYRKVDVHEGTRWNLRVATKRGWESLSHGFLSEETKKKGRNLKEWFDSNLLLGRNWICL